MIAADSAAAHPLAEERDLGELSRLDPRRLRFLPDGVHAEGDRRRVRHRRSRPVSQGIFLTLAARPLGAFVFGLLADRFGRRPILMIDILLFSILEFASGFAPTCSACSSSASCSGSRWAANGGSARRW
jgi:MFS family permease